jgi:hypothetical protein
MTINVGAEASSFAEDKDVAARIRETSLRPEVLKGHSVVLDFTGVRLTTQSFIHALISDVLRREGEGALDLLMFKGCSKEVKGIIGTVVQYSLEGGGQ